MAFEGGTYPHKYPTIRIAEDPVDETPTFLRSSPIPLEQDSEEQEEIDQSRRALLKGLGTVTAAGVATYTGIRFIREQGSTETPRQKEQADTLAKETKKVQQETVERFPIERTVVTGALEGTYIGDLAAKYFDWSPKQPLPKEFIRRFDVTQRKLNTEKNIRYPNAFNQEVARYLEAVYKKQLSEGKENRTTLIETMHNADREAKDIFDTLDWEKAQILYGLSTEGVATLRQLAGRIDGTALTAYSTTEIISSGKNAATNVKIYGLLLQSGGEGFVTLATPALYDNQESFGKYQFTTNAIYNGPNERMPRNRHGEYPIEYRGASKMNRALPEATQIPDDILGLLTMKLQDRAAYLFALHNIAETIHAIAPANHTTAQHVPMRRGGPQVVNAHEIQNRERRAHEDESKKLLENLLHMPSGALLEFISTSHHEPHPAKHELITYLHTDLKTPFKAHCKPDLQKYAQHTDAHHQALVQMAAAESHNSQQAVG